LDQSSNVPETGPWVFKLSLSHNDVHACRVTIFLSEEHVLSEDTSLCRLSVPCLDVDFDSILNRSADYVNMLKDLFLACFSR